MENEQNIGRSRNKNFILVVSDVVFFIVFISVFLIALADSLSGGGYHLILYYLIILLILPAYAVIRGILCPICIGRIWLPNIIFSIIMTVILRITVVTGAMFILSAVSSLITHKIISANAKRKSKSTGFDTAERTEVTPSTTQFSVDPTCVKLLVGVMLCYLALFIIDASFFAGDPLLTFFYTSLIFPICAVGYSIKAYQTTNKIWISGLIYFAASMVFVMLFSVFIKIADVFDIGPYNFRLLIKSLKYIGAISFFSVLASGAVCVVTGAVLSVIEKFKHQSS